MTDPKKERFTGIVKFDFDSHSLEYAQAMVRYIANKVLEEAGIDGVSSEIEHHGSVMKKYLREHPETSQMLVTIRYAVG